ncbi:MAG: hypothetical protein IJV43_10135 [Oscillospiraceae bacterium]|nr:hypothetical protein [Oscillospiraceae bacterium]
MTINEIRVYAEVLEQGLDFGEYIRQAGYTGKIVNVYAKKARDEFSERDSKVDRIRKVKDVDVLISAISEDNEQPLLMVEYSTAVPTDDHKMQRSDVYYWGAVFQVPTMKISPIKKGMSQDFGGGSRILDEQEQRLAFDRKALLFPIKWETIAATDALRTKDNALSCIYHSEEIQRTISSILSSDIEAGDYDSWYEALIEQYEQRYRTVLERTSIADAKSSIVNSRRFHWYGDKLSVKINRFGHAMDPDRGALYYVNMLVGAKNTITEIQVNRPDNLESRGGYHALFDALAREDELLRYVTNLINTANNVFSDENALYVLKHGLNIEHAICFVQKGPHKYIIRDDVLESFFRSHPSIVAKTIFFLSTELRLTDKNRKTICTIHWNEAPIRRYLESVNTANRRLTGIKPLSGGKVKEDIITFASVELYKRLGYQLLAESYPGAQGDRCILTGNGKTTRRTYVDVIAYKNVENGMQVFLQECKDWFYKSQADVEKLGDIVAGGEKLEKLKTLLRKIIGDDRIVSLHTAVAAKKPRLSPEFSVDYVFQFQLSHDEEFTYLDCTVVVNNAELAAEFAPLASQGELSERIKLDRVYMIE